MKTPKKYLDGLFFLDDDLDDDLDEHPKSPREGASEKTNYLHFGGQVPTPSDSSNIAPSSP